MKKIFEDTIKEVSRKVDLNRLDNTFEILNLELFLYQSSNIDQ